MCFLSAWQRLVHLILFVAFWIIFLLLCFLVFPVHALSAVWISSESFSISLLLILPKLQDYVLCQSATDSAQEIYWPRVPPFDTQDMANRSCAISHLLRLPSKADLSCLQAIFKRWASETYYTSGSFISGALHLSDLIQACRRSYWSMLYIYTPLLRQTRAPMTSPVINTLVGLTAGETFLCTSRRSGHKLHILFAVHIT